jgi:thiol-disulfide isomerase/thioredoxin
VRWPVQAFLARLGPTLAASPGRALVVLLALASPTCSKSDGPPPVYEDAPEFSARALDGEEVELADLRGTVVLINVWATWCEPCVAELPHLADLHNELADRGFTVIGLNADVISKRLAVRRMVEHHELPYPIWLDPESQAQVAFKLRGYPTSILVDRQGKIRWRREGIIVPGDAELMPILEQALNE